VGTRHVTCMNPVSFTDSDAQRTACIYHMKNRDRPFANPHVVIREEFDDWAVLFDPDTGHGFGLNPVGVYVWKLLDGEHSINDLLAALRRGVPTLQQNAREHIASFVEDLVENGLAGYAGARSCNDRQCSSLHAACVAENIPHKVPPSHQPCPGTVVYEQPRLELLGQERRAHGNCTSGSHHLAGACNTGNAAGCGSGGSVGYACSNGTAAGFPPTCNGGSLRSPYGFGCGCATGGADYIPDCSTGTGPM